MNIELISDNINYNTAVRTSFKDDELLCSLIENDEYLAHYKYAHSDIEVDDDVIDYEDAKNNKIVKLIQNICRRNKIKLPKIRPDLEFPEIERNGNKVSFFCGCDFGRGDDMTRIRGYKWKNVNVSIDIRDIDTVNENVVKLLKEVKNHRNFEEEDRDMIARFEKDLNTKMSYVNYYTRLLQIEKTLKSEKERLDKNISYYRGFPF